MSVSNFSTLNSCLITSMDLKQEDDFGLNLQSTSSNYYHEYCRLYYANVVLTAQMKELVSQRDALIDKVEKMEDEEDMDSNGGKLRRQRRPANLISRHFRCEVQSCQKSYGSQGSLNQHLKLKHPEIYSELSEKSEEIKIKFREE